MHRRRRARHRTARPMIRGAIISMAVAVTFTMTLTLGLKRYALHQTEARFTAFSLCLLGPKLAPNESPTERIEAINLDSRYNLVTVATLARNLIIRKTGIDPELPDPDSWPRRCTPYAFDMVWSEWAIMARPVLVEEARRTLQEIERGKIPTNVETLWNAAKGLDWDFSQEGLVSLAPPPWKPLIPTRAAHQQPYFSHLTQQGLDGQPIEAIGVRGIIEDNGINCVIKAGRDGRKLSVLVCEPDKFVQRDSLRRFPYPIVSDSMSAHSNVNSVEEEAKMPQRKLARPRPILLGSRAYRHADCRTAAALDRHFICSDDEGVWASQLNEHRWTLFSAPVEPLEVKADKKRWLISTGGRFLQSCYTGESHVLLTRQRYGELGNGLEPNLDEEVNSFLLKDSEPILALGALDGSGGRFGLTCNPSALRVAWATTSYEEDRIFVHRCDSSRCEQRSVTLEEGSNLARHPRYDIDDWNGRKYLFEPLRVVDLGRQILVLSGRRLLKYRLAPQENLAGSEDKALYWRERSEVDILTRDDVAIIRVGGEFDPHLDQSMYFIRFDDSGSVEVLYPTCGDIGIDEPGGAGIVSSP